jgi:predicted DNA-binding transcriptional regulator AlpA
MKPQPIYLLTTAQVADRLGVSPKTLRNYRSAGRWPDFPQAVYLGAAPRFHASEVEAFIERRTPRAI